MSEKKSPSKRIEQDTPTLRRLGKMKFCTCNNLVRAVITSNMQYHECSACNIRYPFVDQDTLIYMPETEPQGYDKHAHVLKHMNYVRKFHRIDKQCINCPNNISITHVIFDSASWYTCPKCYTLFQ